MAWLTICCNWLKLLSAWIWKTVTVPLRASPTNSRSFHEFIPFAPGNVPVACLHVTSYVERTWLQRFCILVDWAIDDQLTGLLASQYWTLVDQVKGP